jgi:SMC interacting uncharacterized protein involved in chromosome segregation
MDWDTVVPAVIALLTSLTAIFGSHKRINKNVLSFLNEIVDNKVQIKSLLDELTELRDELKRND